MGKNKQFPGKPRNCDNVPGSLACKKTRKNGGMYCKDCSAVK